MIDPCKALRPSLLTGLITALLVFTLIPKTYAACEVPGTNGLIGHWRLDETSGTTATDSAGSNNGSMQGGLSGTNDSVSGQVSTALDFDGGNDW